MAPSERRTATQTVLYSGVFAVAAGLALTSGPRTPDLRAESHLVPADRSTRAEAFARAALTPDPWAGSEAGGVASASRVSAEPTEVDWRLLAGLDYRTGEMTEELEAVIGTEAKVPGFMVPLEDYLEEVTEFLLVPYVGACVHTPPPPPNQLVYVKMKGSERAKVEWWNPIWIEGILQLETTENIYGEVSYIMEADRIRPYEY